MNKVVKIACNPIFTMLLILGLQSPLVAQKKIKIEDIWAKNTFSTRSVPGFSFEESGRTYLRQVGNTVEKYDILTGEKVGVVIDGNELFDLNGKSIAYSSYTISPDERYFLLEINAESIYRHSVKANHLIWDSKDKLLLSLDTNSKQMYPTFSPDSRSIAFVQDNDLYIYSIEKLTTSRITFDGKYNHVINGAADWVYEEEFALTRAFEWSYDSRFIGFIRFDETEVPSFTLEFFTDELYPESVVFKYPKVGEKNAEVSLHLFDTKTAKTTQVEFDGAANEEYIPRIFWCAKGLAAFRLNRHQNHLQITLIDPLTGITVLLLEEKNKYYIDINDDLTFLKEKSWFIWSSEMNGFQHLYLYDLTGKMIRPLTSGNFDVTAFYGVDEKNGRIYFQAAIESPLQRQVYSVDLNGKNLKKLTPLSGWNSAQFSADFEYFVNTHSTINTPNTYTLHDKAGNIVRVIEQNVHIAPIQQTYDVVKPEFFTFNTSEGVTLNGYMIKPANFDPSKKYPVFMFLYGGPNSQQVTDNWKGNNYWWFQMLAQNGYLVACIDNRGTGARGEAFRKITYMQLGHYETIDQIEAAKYLASLPYTDASRIGIYGWSYGGYMSSLCILKGADVFKAAIAVAPVTNWKWYDTIYTERYMRTLNENPDGYRNNSPIYFTDNLKGKFLLVHGMADDNVHFQNTVEMANALIRSNKQFDTYFYPNRNHGIYGGKARLHLFTKMTQFIYDNI
jgi:dipeptidyl-peptidase 4